MLKELLKPEIQELIEKHKWYELKDALTSWPAAEIADLLLDVEKHDKVLIFRVLPRDIAADVFSYLELEQRDTFLLDLTDFETRQLLTDLAPDDRTDLFEELPAKATRRLMNLLSPEDLKEAKQLLGYPEDSVGRAMTPDFVAVKSNWSVKRAIEHIRKFGKDSETIYRIYVTGKHGKLLDDILLRNLIIADPEQTVADLMDHNVISLSAFDDQEEAVKIFDRYDLFAVPVVDSQGVLVGIVTFDDVLDISEEEATEDFQKISGISPVDQSYLSASHFKLWRKRLPSISIMLVVNLFTVLMLSKFNHILDAQTALTFFISLIIGTAGNSGTQSATLIIRSITIEEVEFGDIIKIFFKEIFVGIMMGIILAILAFLVAIIVIDSSNIKVAYVVAISVMALVVWGCVLGGTLPLIISRIGIDPAIISSPLITTLIDFSGSLVYMLIAIWILNV